MTDKEETRKRPVGDQTKPHLKRFFEVKKIGDEPALNREGFWQKPDFSLKKALKKGFRK